MALLICKVIEIDGASTDETTVAVENSKGKVEYLQVPASFIHLDHGNTYIPVSIVHLDRSSGQLLIQLPFEADSGANRLWVRLDHLLRPDEVAV